MTPVTFPTQLLINQYRCFKSETSLLLRPLTLIYGRNNAGKSALLRLVRLLDPLAARHTRDGNLLRLLEPPYSSGGLESLLPKGQDDFEIHLTLEWDKSNGTTERWVYTLNVNNDRFQISDLEWQNALGTSGKVSFRDTKKKYVIQVNGVDLQQTLGFSGLIPEDRIGPLPPALQTLRERMLSLSGRVQWLLASRTLPIKELYPRQDPTARMLAPDASNAVELLATHQYDLLPEVNRWYRGQPTHLKGLKCLEGSPERELLFQDITGRGYEVRLVPSNGRDGEPADFRLTLAESGEGMSHVLPVLLGIELARQACKRDALPSLFAVEEPESHLHADAQRALAQYMAGSVANTNGLTLVMETHSQALLLAIQVEVANGRLPAEAVAINWVEQVAGEHRVRSFLLDHRGRPNAPGFPDSAFSDVDQLRDLLIEAQP